MDELLNTMINTMNDFNRSPYPKREKAIIILHPNQRKHWILALRKCDRMFRRLIKRRYRVVYDQYLPEHDKLYIAGAGFKFKPLTKPVIMGGSDE